jgi:diguanylate cyclase (GGDEF)-like protein
LISTDSSALSTKLLRPIELGNYIGFLGTTLLAWFLLQTDSERIFLVCLSLSAAGFNYIMLHRLLPRDATRRLYYYIAAAGLLVIISGYTYLLTPYTIHLEILFIALVAGVGILVGNRAAYISTLLFSALYILVLLLLGLSTTGGWISLSLHSLFFLLAGYWSSNLTGLIHERLLYSNRQNRYLSLLLKVGTLASQRDTLEEVLPHIAASITTELPVTTCKILLWNPENQALTSYGSSPLRSLRNWGASAAQSLNIQEFPQIGGLFQTGRYQIFGESSALSPDGARLISILAFSAAKTLGLFPLMTKGKILGLIAVGENRAWEREPFTQEKIDLLQTLAIQIASAIDNAGLFKAVQHQAQRLAVLNEVGKAIGSTLELDDLLELIYNQLSKVIPTETYYVALNEPEEGTLDFRILIDDGKRFPPQRIPLTQGLSSWVIENRRPLLVRQMSKEIDSLPVRPIQLGQQQASESWLGVPVQTGERDLGILAIASYVPFAFDEDDMTLLTNIAAQAALALDNARQHAAVKEQARRDSLTGALNHGCFLTLLDESIQLASRQNSSVSLIMLDIDLFKEYNDRYGHLVGDEILRQMVPIISPLLNPGDFIGRWGGEEFAIGLPGTDLDQAVQTAQKIRLCLARVELHNRGQAIPAPTLSQGIATYPQHAQNSDQLVDIADAALYSSKNAGRDQLTPAYLEIH